MAKPSTSSHPTRRVAVVGAGWAGCAAAVHLARAGASVTVFEAARTLGGRARQVMMQGHSLDNGQHIMLGAYQQTLQLMKQLGMDASTLLYRLPMQMCFPFDSGMEFVAARLPAPLHLMAGLLRASGLNRHDKLALARFSSAARWMGWQLDDDCTVDTLLWRFDQTPRLIALLWRPLCIAALNTPPARASANIFLNVLKDSLGASRAASDMLVPRVDLTALLPQQAARYIERSGGVVHLGARVRRLKQVPAGWIIDGSQADSGPTFDQVVVATDPVNAATLLAEHIDTTSLAALTYEPITTCYLQYGSNCRLSRPFFALIDDAARPAQFVFDRGQLDGMQAGLFAAVVSASDGLAGIDQQEVTRAIAHQLAEQLRMPNLTQPLWTKLITEKRATFSCSPGLQRPSQQTALEGLALAGDYTAGPYPATLEAAVASGVRAAALLAGRP